MFRIKGTYKEILQEHKVSVICMVVAMILYSSTAHFMDTIASRPERVVDFISAVLFVFSIGMLPFEAYRSYKVKECGKDFTVSSGAVIAKIVVIIFSLLLGGVIGLFSSVTMQELEERVAGYGIGRDEIMQMSDISGIVALCFLFIMYAIAAYFFYKKSGLSAGKYLLKLFLGVLMTLFCIFVSMVAFFVIGYTFIMIVAELYVLYLMLMLAFLAGVMYPLGLILVSKTNN